MSELRELGLKFVRDPKSVTDVQLYRMWCYCHDEIDDMHALIGDGRKLNRYEEKKYDKYTRFVCALTAEMERREKEDRT